MVLYDIVITSKAETQLLDCIDYLCYQLMNVQAAMSLEEDFIKTGNCLSYLAESLRFCTDPILAEAGFRVIKLKKHKYLMIYKVIERTVYIEAIYHQSQDYENLFSDSLNID